MKAAGSLGVVVCLFLVVVGVLVEVVPMAEGDTTPSQCKQEKDLLVSACKSAVINKSHSSSKPSPRLGEKKKNLRSSGAAQARGGGGGGGGGGVGPTNPGWPESNFYPRSKTRGVTSCRRQADVDTR
ncbi:unnamed protein product [Prunus armeniaca]